MSHLPASSTGSPSHLVQISPLLQLPAFPPLFLPPPNPPEDQPPQDDHDDHVPPPEGHVPTPEKVVPPLEPLLQVIARLHCLHSGGVPLHSAGDPPQEPLVLPERAGPTYLTSQPPPDRQEYLQSPERNTATVMEQVSRSRSQGWFKIIFILSIQDSQTAKRKLKIRNSQ